MRDFIKNYIDIFDDMGTYEEERIDAIIGIYETLKERNAKDIYLYIVKPLLTEYRDTEDKATIEDIEELFKQLLQVVI